jgi:hypothetical protein
MARCGRCGLWNQYPDEYKEQKWAGVCLWYQHRLTEDAVFEERTCPDFFEKVPQLTPVQHFDYKLKRDNLGDAYETAKRSKRIAYVGVTLSVISLTWAILKEVS